MITPVSVEAVRIKGADPYYPILAVLWRRVREDDYEDDDCLIVYYNGSVYTTSFEHMPDVDVKTAIVSQGVDRLAEKLGNDSPHWQWAAVVWCCERIIEAFRQEQAS